MELIGFHNNQREFFCDIPGIKFENLPQDKFIDDYPPLW